MSNIEKYGCHITSVFDPEEKDINFTYTVGIKKSENKPELIIPGLRSELASWIANEYNRRVKEGEKFNTSDLYSDFLEGFDIRFKPVCTKYKEKLMLSCDWLYSGSEFEVLQLIYPTVKGVWPWQPKANKSFKELQPSLQDPPEW